MSKEDYRDKIEEHRQSFEVEQDQEQEQPLSRVSRMNRDGGNNKGPKKTKPAKNPLMKILLVIFIFIPFLILVLVWYFYEPGVSLEEAEGDTTNELHEIEKPSSGKNTVHADEKDKEKDKEKEDEEAEKKAQEQAQKDAERLEAEKKAVEEKAAAEKAAEEAKIAQQKAAEEARKAEEAKKQEAASAKTHTVRSNETLYRIAVNYYGDGSEATLAKIRAANGMSSNTVMVGQVIKLP